MFTTGCVLGRPGVCAPSVSKLGATGPTGSPRAPDGYTSNTPSFKLCFRSSQPFVGVCDLGGSGAAARRRPPRCTCVAVAAAVGRCPCGPSHVGKVTLVNVCECHPCYLLEAPGGAKRSSPPVAGAGPAAGASARPGRGWRPASPDGWRPWRSAWASVCSSRPIRFGFILALGSSRPVCPPATAESDAELPEGPPGIARALAARLGRARALPSWQAPHKAGNGCLQHRLRLVFGGTRRGPELPPGAARSGIARGPVPSRPVLPGPPISPGRAGPRLVP